MYTYPRISEYMKCTTKEHSNKTKNRRDPPHESATSFIHFRIVRLRRLRCRRHRYQQTALKRCISSTAVSASCALLDWQVTPTKASGFAPDGGLPLLSMAYPAANFCGCLLSSKLYFSAAERLDQPSRAIVCLRSLGGTRAYLPNSVDPHRDRGSCRRRSSFYTSHSQPAEAAF